MARNRAPMWGTHCLYTDAYNGGQRPALVSDWDYADLFPAWPPATLVSRLTRTHTFMFRLTDYKVQNSERRERCGRIYSYALGATAAARHSAVGCTLMLTLGAVQTALGAVPAEVLRRVHRFLVAYTVDVALPQFLVTLHVTPAFSANGVMHAELTLRGFPPYIRQSPLDWERFLLCCTEARLRAAYILSMSLCRRSQRALDVVARHIPNLDTAALSFGHITLLMPRALDEVPFPQGTEPFP
jgi:hypothetical protein